VASEPASSPLTPWVCRATRNLLGAAGASITLENSTPRRVTLCATDKPAGLLVANYVVLIPVNAPNGIYRLPSSACPPRAATQKAGSSGRASQRVYLPGLFDVRYHQ
jgi:hypothetical protein